MLVFGFATAALLILGQLRPAAGGRITFITFETPTANEYWNTFINDAKDPFALEKKIGQTLSNSTVYKQLINVLQHPPQFPFAKESNSQTNQGSFKTAGGSQWRTLGQFIACNIRDRERRDSPSSDFGYKFELDEIFDVENLPGKFIDQVKTTGVSLPSGVLENGLVSALNTRMRRNLETMAALSFIFIEMDTTVRPNLITNPKYQELIIQRLVHLFLITKDKSLIGREQITQLQNVLLAPPVQSVPLLIRMGDNQPVSNINSKHVRVARSRSLDDGTSRVIFDSTGIRCLPYILAVLLDNYELAVDSMNSMRYLFGDQHKYLQAQRRVWGIIEDELANRYKTLMPYRALHPLYKTPKLSQLVLNNAFSEFAGPFTRSNTLEDGILHNEVPKKSFIKRLKDLSAKVPVDKVPYGVKDFVAVLSDNYEWTGLNMREFEQASIAVASFANFDHKKSLDYLFGKSQPALSAKKVIQRLGYFFRSLIIWDNVELFEHIATEYLENPENSDMKATYCSQTHSRQPDTDAPLFYEMSAELFARHVKLCPDAKISNTIMHRRLLTIGEHCDSMELYHAFARGADLWKSLSSEHRLGK